MESNIIVRSKIDYASDSSGSITPIEDPEDALNYPQKRPPEVIESWSLFDDEKSPPGHGIEIKVTSADAIAPELELTDSEPEVTISDVVYDSRVRGIIRDGTAGTDKSSDESLASKTEDSAKSEHMVSGRKDGERKSRCRVSFHDTKTLEKHRKKTVKKYTKAEADYLKVNADYERLETVSNQLDAPNKEELIARHVPEYLYHVDQDELINKRVQVLKEKKQKLNRLKAKSKYILDEIDNKYLWAMHNSIRKLRHDIDKEQRWKEKEGVTLQLSAKSAADTHHAVRESLSKHASSAPPSRYVGLIPDTGTNACISTPGTNISYCIPSFLKSTREQNTRKQSEPSEMSLRSESSTISSGLLSLPCVAKRPFFKPSAYRISPPHDEPAEASHSQADVARFSSFQGSIFLDSGQIALATNLSVEERESALTCAVREAKRHIQVYENEMLLLELGYKEEDRLGIGYPDDVEKYDDQVKFIKQKLMHWTKKKIDAEEQLSIVKKEIRREESRKKLTRRDSLDEAREKEKSISAKYNRNTMKIQTYKEELRRLVLGYHDKQRMGVDYPPGLVTMAEKESYLRNKTREFMKKRDDLKREKTLVEQKINKLEIEKEKKRIQSGVEEIKKEANIWELSIRAISFIQSGKSLVSTTSKATSR